MSISELKVVHERISADFKSGKGVLVTSRWLSSMQASIGESKVMLPEVAASCISLGDSDRIRNQGGDEPEDSSDLESFWSILEHIRVVFPSAVSFVTGDSSCTDTTLLSVAPSVLQKLGAKNVCRALRKGLQTFLPKEEFLSSSSEQESWISSLLSAIEKEGATRVHIPIYALLLYRLEDAFRAACQSSPTTLSVQGSQVPQESESCRCCSPFNAIAFVEALPKCLKELDAAGLETDETKGVIRELVKACGGSDDKTIQLRDFVLTPLALVGRAVEVDGIGSLAAVDDTIKAGLHKYRTASASEGGLDSGSSEEVKPLALPESRQTVRSPSEGVSPLKAKGKKKKKKKPRKKVCVPWRVVRGSSCLVSRALMSIKSRAKERHQIALMRKPRLSKQSWKSLKKGPKRRKTI